VVDFIATSKAAIPAETGLVLDESLLSELEKSGG
jgi:hypothetical protein